MAGKIEAALSALEEAKLVLQPFSQLKSRNTASGRVWLATRCASPPKRCDRWGGG